MRTTTSIILSVLLLLVIGVVYFFYTFLRSFAPANITITETYIASNRGFINGVTINKLHVDSMGSENYPVKYTVTYLTSCHIEYPKDRPPNPPKKIKFTEEGKYWWTEEQVNIHFIHQGMTRETTDSTDRAMSVLGTQKFKICPMKFDREQWYFFTFGDPQITGIFFFIDKSGKNYQHAIHSGVSPI